MEAKANNRIDNIKSDPISAKLAEVLEVVSLEKALIRTIGRVSSGLPARYPASRHQAVVARTIEFLNEIVASRCILCGNVDQYSVLANKLELDLRLLEREIPQPTECEKWVRIVSREWRGNGPELDELFAVLKPDEQILQVDWQAATVAQPNGERRIITRQSLRLRSRPSYSDKSPEAWIRQWDAIEDPHPEPVNMEPIVNHRAF